MRFGVKITIVYKITVASYTQVNIPSSRSLPTKEETMRIGVKITLAYKILVASYTQVNIL